MGRDGGPFRPPWALAATAGVLDVGQIVLVLTKFASNSRDDCEQGYNPWC